MKPTKKKFIKKHLITKKQKNFTLGGGKEKTAKRNILCEYIQQSHVTHLKLYF